MTIACCASPPKSRHCLGADRYMQSPGGSMPQPSYLQGAGIWKGAEMAQSHRWVREFPAVVLEQIDLALEKVKDLEWRNVNRHNFPLPDAATFFDDLREELENGSGMVRIRG